MNVLNLAVGGKVGARRAPRVRAGGRHASTTRATCCSPTRRARTTPVWMSHGDRVTSAGRRASRCSRTATTRPIAALRRPRPRRSTASSSTPRSTHTPRGREILRNFLFRVCGAQADWTMEDFVDAMDRAHPRAGRRRAASSAGSRAASTRPSRRRSSTRRSATGSPASSSTTACCARGEADAGRGALRASAWRFDVRRVDAGARFLERLAGVDDPERSGGSSASPSSRSSRRRRRRSPDVDFLAQGTLYPDVIESVSFKGPSATIKSHHNVGGLPGADAAQAGRAAARAVQGRGARARRASSACPRRSSGASRFPGPGLAVRILGAVDRGARSPILRDADAIVAARRSAPPGSTTALWQAFAVLLPVKTVGVMGDERTYENVVAIRAVASRRTA